ncbi:MAG: hypothetical protein JO199_03510, partial [Candidatus Eremiobacteraeota bacterium]|nr:hypothetical protein [Candidatus Eremiobacteraeota bacterium]
MKQLLGLLVVSGALIAAGCSHPAGSALCLPGPAAPYQLTPRAQSTAGSIPGSYKCFPAGLPAVARRPELAYAEDCSVASAQESANLQAMAIAMMFYKAPFYLEYCTGTPVAFDTTARVGFVVTAAHCVVGGTGKPAGTTLTSAQ